MYTISKYIMNPSSKTVFMSNPESLLYTFNKCLYSKDFRPVWATSYHIQAAPAKMFLLEIHAVLFVNR